MDLRQATEKEPEITPEERIRGRMTRLGDVLKSDSLSGLLALLIEMADSAPISGVVEQLLRTKGVGCGPGAVTVRSGSGNQSGVYGDEMSRGYSLACQDVIDSILQVRGWEASDSVYVKLVQEPDLSAVIAALLSAASLEDALKQLNGPLG